MKKTDNSIFENILEKYGDMVYRIAYTHVLDKDMAEDIVQEVFLKLVRHIDRLSEGEHMKYWLIRTAVNQSLTANRHFFRRHEYHEQGYANDDTLSADLKMVISSLPESCRAAAVLCCCEGYTAEEAAIILHRNVNTVKSQVARAKKKLRKELEGTL